MLRPEVDRLSDVDVAVEIVQKEVGEGCSGCKMPESLI